MLLFIYILLILAFGAGIFAVAGKAIESRANVKVKELRQTQQERDVALGKIKIAEHGLRKIANGVAGNPALEAQVILDDIENVKAIG